MYDRSRLTRLITCALASCAATWALAATAPAHPAAMAAGQAAAAPAFVAVPGDTDKAPSTAPAYQPQIGDHLKQPNAAQVDRVLAGLGQRGSQSAGNGGADHTATIALIAAIAALVAALGALVLAVVRTDRPMVGT